MKVAFSQVYIEPGISFPFSVDFQRRLTNAVTASVTPSTKFQGKYGADFELGILISAKRGLVDNDVRGPSCSKKYKVVDYTVFLPFDPIVTSREAPRLALAFLLQGVADVFDKLEFDKTRFLDQRQSLIDAICSDPMMLAKPSWNEEDNDTLVRRLFVEFYAAKGLRH